MIHRARPLWAAVLAFAACGCGAARQTSTDSNAAAVDRCTHCHGDPTRAASASTDPLVAAAPPRGVRGGTAPTDPDVGAHQRHLADGPTWKAIACSSCHALPRRGI